MKPPKPKREKTKRQPPKKPKKRVVYEADDIEGVANVAASRKKKLNEMNVPLAKRVALQKDTSEELKEISGRFGAKEYSYVPKSSRKQAKDTGDEDPEKSQRRGQRRGIKELGLKRQKM